MTRRLARRAAFCMRTRVFIYASLRKKFGLSVFPGKL